MCCFFSVCNYFYTRFQWQKSEIYSSDCVWGDSDTQKYFLRVGVCVLYETDTWKWKWSFMIINGHLEPLEEGVNCSWSGITDTPPGIYFFEKNIFKYQSIQWLACRGQRNDVIIGYSPYNFRISKTKSHLGTRYGMCNIFIHYTVVPWYLNDVPGWTFVAMALSPIANGSAPIANGSAPVVNGSARTGSILALVSRVGRSLLEEFLTESRRSFSGLANWNFLFRNKKVADSKEKSEVLHSA